MAPLLYSAPESGNCYKVRLLASLLSIPLELRNLDFFNKEQKSPWFLAINPKGELPALVDGNRILTDSSAILVHLAGTYADGTGIIRPPSSFWSADVAEQAQIVEWLAFTAGSIHSGLCRARALLAFNWPPNASDESIREAQRTGASSLQLLEKRLETAEWLAVGRPTIADVAVFVYVGLAPMGGISLEPFPAVRTWLERMRGLQGFLPPDGLDQPLKK